LKRGVYRVRNRRARRVMPYFGRRKRETTAAIRRPASSISASLKSALKLKRMAEWSKSGGTLIALRTGDGSNEPLEQAEPVEQATPARSRFISSVSDWQPGNDRFKVCGRPPFSGPFRTTGGT